MSTKPKVPKTKNEVRWAAGYTPEFINVKSSEKTRFRVLHEMDEEARVWISSCLEYHAHVESELGASLADAQRVIVEEIACLIGDGELFELPKAPDEDFATWDAIQKINKRSKDGGGIGLQEAADFFEHIHDAGRVRVFEVPG